MALREPKYLSDISILKRYGYGENTKLKLTTLKLSRNSNIACDEESPCTKKGTVNEEKLRENISRAKSNIFELAFCNEWQYFVTLTIDGAKQNRSDLDSYVKKLTQWFRNEGKKKNTKIEYLLIAELHSSGDAWHMHGFIRGLPPDELHQFQIGDKMSSDLAAKVKEGETLYNWLGYNQKFGYCTLSPVRNIEAVSKYVTKYITKDLAKSVTKLNAHLYYCSKGLSRAETIKKGCLSYDLKQLSKMDSYENDYCKIWWYDVTDIEQITAAIL